MVYKIHDICNNLSLGKSTIYKRIETLKQDIPEENWKCNEYFYYDQKNKLFITEKGFDYIKKFKFRNDNTAYNSNQKEIMFYQNHLIEMYKSRIEYLESENKRLIDIISIKEQRELAKDVERLNPGEHCTFLNKFFNLFKK